MKTAPRADAGATRVHWRHLLPIFFHPYRGYLALHRRFGPILAVERPGRRPVFFVADEPLATKILVDHGDTITRPSNVIRDVFRTIVGDNIVATSGGEWEDKRHRGTQRLKASTVEEGQAEALLRCVRELIDDVRRASAGGGRVDLLQLIERYTLTAAMRLISGREVDRGSDTFREVLEAMRYTMQATQRIADVRKQMFLYAALPWARRVVDRRRFARLKDAVRRIAEFEPDPEVRELFMAGYENPSTTLTWALALLGKERGCQDRLRAEASTLDIAGGQGVTVAALEGCRYADAVVRETARLRPAIAYLARQAQADVEIDGVKIPRGCHIVIVPWCLHMNAARWIDPERFDPGRFMSDGDERRRGASQRLWSFGFGPRACVGTRYALQVLAAALVAIAREVRWSLAPGFEPPAPTGHFPWSEKIHCHLTLDPIH